MNTPKLSPPAVHLLKGVKEKILKEPHLYDHRQVVGHNCGTTCCIAGWLCFIKEGSWGAAIYRGVGPEPLERAASYLGFELGDITNKNYPLSELFGFSGFTVEEYINEACSVDDAQRAKAGAKIIDRFIEKYT